jgi:pimeloyl-ACP methyl ester carboxylesterase
MSDRPTLILVPAMPCDGDLYAAQIEACADLVDAQVMILDASDMAANAARLLASAPPRFLLAGTAFGGALALEVAATAPERIAGLWLMNCNPGAHPDPDEVLQMQRRVEAGDYEGVLAELAQLVVGDTDVVARQRFLAMARRAGSDRFLRQNRAAGSRRDHWPKLPRLAIPTLLLWGAQDRLVPLAIGQRLAAEIPTAKLVALPDAHHLPTLQQPTLVNVALRSWLTEIL